MLKTLKNRREKNEHTYKRTYVQNHVYAEKVGVCTYATYTNC